MPNSRSTSRLPALTSAVVALATAVAILGVPIVLLTLPVYTRVAESRLVDAEETGLTRDAQLAAAEAVRRYIVDDDAPALPTALEGRAAFGGAAVQHLLDVRRVVTAARYATLAALLVLAAAAAFALRLRRPRPLGLGLLAGAGGLAVLVAGAAAFAVVDFASFFSAFHGLFFAEGTWTFPSDSLLIRLFPERFWALSGALWGALALVLSVAAALAGRRLAPSKHDRSSSSEDRLSLEKG